MSPKNSRGNAAGPAAGRGRSRGGRGGHSSRGGRGQGRRADESSRRDAVNACDNHANQSQGERQPAGVSDENQYGDVTKNVAVDEEPISQPTSQTASIPVNTVPDGGVESHAVNRTPESPGSSTPLRRSSSALPSASPRGKGNSKANAQANRGGGTVDVPSGNRHGRGQVREQTKLRRKPSTPTKRNREDQENSNGSRKRLRSVDKYRDDDAGGSDLRIVRTSNGDNDEIIKEMRSLYRRMCSDNQQLNQTLCNENRLLRDVVKKLEQSVESLLRNFQQGKLNGADRYRRDANANTLTPKKLYEELMGGRLEGLEDVFSSPNLQAACWRVLIRFIMKNVVGTRIPSEQIIFVLNTVMYGLPREWKNSQTRSREGNASSEIRRSIIMECVRQASNMSGDNRPFWLKGCETNSKESPYLNVRFVQEGFERRERGRSVADKSLKRRNAIGNGTAKPSKDDDSEYLGWWAYGKLNKFLNQGRKNANALVFENIFYIFAKWLYSVDDRAMDEKELKNLPGYTEKQVAEIVDVMSKNSLSFEWNTDISDEGSSVLRIPDCVTSLKNRQTSEKNRQLYTAFAMSQQNLLLTVEHKVHVHKDEFSKGSRQRKGGELKMYRKRLTLLDTASDFLIGLCYGDRNLFGWDFMRYNKNTLKALYSLALCFRHVIDAQLKECNVLTPRGCPAISNANAENNSNGDVDRMFEMKKMYVDLLPNEQLQGRIISRCVWGVRASDYKSEHLGDGVCRTGEGVDGSSSQAVGTWGLDDDEDEFGDDDDDEDELNYIVNGSSDVGRSERENGSERMKDRRTGRSQNEHRNYDEDDDCRDRRQHVRSQFEETPEEESEGEERRAFEDSDSDNEDEDAEEYDRGDDEEYFDDDHDEM